MENLNYLAHNLTIYSHTDLREAFNSTQSEAELFLEGKAFNDWVKVKESEQKLQASLGERLNGVIRACGMIVKAISILAKRWR
ncbi:hypothetical protein CW311_04535 [Acinetobacter proteolyticus]|uniref:Uncharacterized protein n=1 Tax=Acinetobacter proteolyticus TaxID=1776741 RepID=A0A2N0WIH2_9GAMM|nr:hypothetical protein CW311_04535 [Acinetobacter proteolyticus]